MPRLTKAQIGRAMKQIERSPTFENAQAGAELLGHPIQTDIDGLPLYRGTVYPKRDELIEELLLDLGNRQRSI